jgi:DNA-binding transcriptional MocR family regulator
MINLQSNYPVLAGQEAEWGGLLHEAVARYGMESLRLPVFGGSEANRAKAADWLGLPLERVFVCTGGHHGTLAALMAARLAGKTVAVEELTYPWFVGQAQMLNMQVVSVAMDGECMRPDALREACAVQKMDAVYTMPTLHNPTGAVASPERRRQIVDVAREFDLAIIEDSAYGWCVMEPLPRYADLAPERSFYVESLSKRAAPGVRTCFLAVPEDLADETALALRLIASGSPTLLVSMGCEMAADGSLLRLVQHKQFLGSLREQMAKPILAGLDRVTGPNAWHTWVTLPDGDKRTEEDIERECEQRGVLITGARWFTAPGAAVPRAVRVAYGGETDDARFVQGLEMFADVMRG